MIIVMIFARCAPEVSEHREAARRLVKGERQSKRNGREYRLVL